MLSRGPNNIRIENAAYMVTTVTLNRHPLFLKRENAFKVVESITLGMARLYFWLYAYVVMPDHVHMIIQPREITLAEGIALIKGRSARSMNVAANKSGSIWQRGYLSRPIVNIAFLEREINYIERNPVRAGLADSTDSYPYSSATLRPVY